MMVPTVSISQRQRTGSGDVPPAGDAPALGDTEASERIVEPRLDLDSDFGMEAGGARWLVRGAAGEGEGRREQSREQDRELALGRDEHACRMSVPGARDGRYSTPASAIAPLTRSRIGVGSGSTPCSSAA